MILPFTMTLAANETREVALQGTRLELRSVPFTVALIELNDESGGIVSRMEQTDATDFVETGRAFKTVRVTNGANAQTIRFYYGDGNSGSNRFSGVVSGTVALDAATLAALEIINNRPEPYSGYTNVIAVLAALTAEQVVAPAANINGVIVQAATMATYQGGSLPVFGGLLAKNAAPANVGDGLMVANCRPVLYDNVNTQTHSAVDMQRDVLVPAGLGLYWYFSAALSANQPRSVRYKVL